MAEYNIDLAVRLAADKALRGLKSLEETADKVANAVRQVGAQDFNQISRGANGARRQVNNLYAAFQRLDKIGKIGAITAATASINQFGQILADSTVQIDAWGQHVQTGIPILNQLGSAVKNVTSFIEPLTHFLQGLDANTQAAVAGLGIATAVTAAFAPQISALGAKTRQCAEAFEQWRKRIFDSVAGLNTSIDVTQAYRNAIRSVTDNVANLSQRQQNAKTALDRYNSTSDEAAVIASTLVSITKRLNNETNNQITLIKNATAAQREFNDQARVRANIAQSSFSRGESGFAAFSQAASRVADENAIEKSIRRQREKLEKAAANAPLMLPSSEMLDAAGRGIQQLSSYYGNLNTQIDAGVQAGQAFTTQLNAQAAKAQGLPPIFGQVERSLQTVAASTKTGSTIQQSWNTALAQGNKWLREDAITTSGINNLTKQILDKDYARIEAQKQLGRLKEQEKQQTRELAALQKAASERAESLALGVGFPLLFGGGLGSVAGGALGSFAGKGFGGQIIFSAIGQQIDALVASVAELGQALDPLTLNLDAVTKASGISGTELEKYIRQLETSEGKTRAASEAQRILASVVGDDGVAALQEFGTATRRLSNAFDRAMATMAAGVARLINSVPGFLRFTANLERGAVLQRALASTDPAQAANLRALERSRVGRGGVDIAKNEAAINALIATQQQIEKGGGSAQDLSILNQELAVAKAQLEVTKQGNDLTQRSAYIARVSLIREQHHLKTQQLLNNTNLTAQAQELEYQKIKAGTERELLQLRNDQAAATERAAKASQQQAAKGARETERITREVALLDIRNNLTEQMLQLDAEIAQAKRQKNVEDVASLERSKIQLQALAREEELRIRISDATELAAKLRESELRKKADLQKLETATADRKQVELDQATKTLNDLDTEFALQKAILNGKGEEFQLEQRAIALAKDNKQLSKEKILDKLKEIESVKELVSEQQRMKQVFADIGMTIKTGIVDAINAAIYQTQTLAEVADNMLRTISNKLLDVAVNLLLFGVPSGVGKGGLFGGFFADGGQPPMGKVSVVGERGPELFVPHTQGSIIPNHALGGSNIVVNVDATGSSVQGNGDDSKRLGEAIGVAIRQELIKQKRPGGLLA